MTRLRATGRGPRLLPFLLYALMVAGAVALFLAINQLGKSLSAPAPAGSPALRGTAELHPSNVLFHVLLALTVMIIAGRGVGAIFARLHQPPVIGEVLAGILLGPSLLGRLAPAVSAYILPAAAAPFLAVIAQLGVILYMFLIGLELDPALLRKRGHSTIAISHASIVFPFVLGAGLALALYPRLATSDVPFTVFALFLGVSMSVTAFPVLARILTDRGMTRTRLGVMAITCAAADDVTAWCLLAFVVSVAQARIGNAVVTIALTLAYIAFMFLAVRPLVTRLVRRFGNEPRMSQWVVAAVFVAMLGSSLVTELIGIHAIFGAFLLGAVMPHDSKLVRTLVDKLENIVIVLLLPAFFALTGMRTQIGLVNGVGAWLVCAAIIAVATLGKFGGSSIAARITGLAWRDSAALGVLMNTRGLMELIVLNIGLDLGVLSPTLFAMLVLMALVTTLATTPLLRLLGSRDDTDHASVRTHRVA